MVDKPRVTNQTRRQFLGVVSGAAIGLTSTVTARETPSDENHHGMCCFRLGGRVSGWQGRGPQSLAGEKNPMLRLESGRTYGLVWQNLDGQPHTFALRDSQGKNLSVILPTVRTMQNGGRMMGGQHGTTMGGHMMDGQHGTRMNGNDGHMMDGENGSMMGKGQGRSTPPKNAIKATPQLSKKGAVQMLAFVATRDIDQYLCTVHPTTMVGKVTVKREHSGNDNHGHGEGSGNGGGS